MSDRRVHITHVVLQLETGGMEKLLVEFARHANRSRFALDFVSLGSRGKIAVDLEKLAWPVTALEEPPGLRAGLMLRLARHFRSSGTDLVHTHNTKPLLYGAPAARLARAAGVVHTRHGQRYRAARRANALFRFATGFADRVVCVSEDGARLSVQEGVARRKLMVIRNGIDTERFNHTGPHAAGPAVLVGRLSPEKDVSNLLRAAALAVRELPTFRLEIAGDGACLPALRAEAESLGLRERVGFLGEVRDVASLLRRASLYVLPSLTEGISLTLLEAMAVGLPVVATRVGGNSEVVADGETGLLVPARDPAALARAMVRIFRDPAQGEVLGRAGRERVEKHFDVRRMVAEYEALYFDLMGRRKVGRNELRRLTVRTR